jgi:hypothetical protein
MEMRILLSYARNLVGTERFSYLRNMRDEDEDEGLSAYIYSSPQAGRKESADACVHVQRVLYY